VREELGERPDLADYLARFPRYADALRRQVDFHAAIARPPATTLVSARERPGPADAGASDDHLDRREHPLLDRRGAGGMGEVFLSRDPGLGRPLALKVMQARWLGDPELERRFQDEARIAGLLQHPAIVPVHNLGRLPPPDGRLYFTMNVVRGSTL